MEVKPGYKQTAVGIIPEKWETHPCSDLSERIMVGIVIRPTQYYVRHGVPAFRSANIREDGISTSDLVFISDASNALLAKSQTRTGDVLTVRTGYPGTSAVVSQAHAGCNCIDILITRPSKKLDSEWLAIWVNSPYGKEQILRNQGGLAQKHFNVEDMRNLVVALPSLPEQRAIASVLSDVDALISRLNQLIAKKRDLKQAAMQQLLTGKQRLPRFRQKPGYKRTDVGVIPEDWEEANLGEKTVKVGSGITPTGGSRVYKQSGHPFLRSQNVGWGCLLMDDVAFIDDHTHESFITTEIEVGDVFLNITGASIGRSAVADSRVQRGNVNQHVCIIRPKNSELDPSFLNKFLLSRVGQRQIDSFQAGGNRQGLNFGQIRSFRLPLPSFPEQTAIATVLSDMEAEIAALEKRREKTRDLKQGMMQELLTGRIRLV